MTSSATLPGSGLRAELMELIHNCPADCCNPEECPLFHVRQLDDYPRLQWLNALDLADLEYLAAYHHVCMKLKLQAPQGGAV